MALAAVVAFVADVYGDTTGVSSAAFPAVSTYNSPSLFGFAEGLPEYALGNKSLLNLWSPLFSREWVGVYTANPYVLGVANTAFPYGPNLGTLWAGKGVNTLVRAGLGVRVGPLEIGVVPVFAASQNLEFPLAQPVYTSDSLFVNPWHRRLDWPQRMGDQALVGVDPGYSFVRLRLGTFSLGYSWEPVWLGPGKDSALLLSSNAPGFAHVDLGVSPTRTPIGAVEARLFWGALRSSPYYQDGSRGEGTPPWSDTRLLTGAVLGYSPSFLPGLTLAFQRILYTYWYHDFRIAQFLSPLTSRFLQNGGADSANQQVSVVVRWVFPVAGFEAYLEYGRDDASASLRDLLGSPEHMRAYIAGVRQQIRVSDRIRFSLTLEQTMLGLTRTNAVRGGEAWYVHTIVREGSTHLGQLLGSWIGPGSNSQYLGADLYVGDSRVGILVRRVAFDVDAYYRMYSGTRGAFLRYDTRIHFGTDGKVDLRILDLEWLAEAIYNLNRYYQNVENVATITGNESDVLSFHFQLGVRVKLPGVPAQGGRGTAPGVSVSPG